MGRRVALPIARQAQALRKTRTRAIQVINTLSGDAHPAGIIVATDLAFDNQQRIFLENVAVLLVELVEHHYFHLCSRIVQRHDQHFAAPRHLRTHRHRNTGKQGQFARGFQAIQIALGESRDFSQIRSKRMAAEKISQRGFFLQQGFLFAPARRINQFFRAAVEFFAKQSSLTASARYAVSGAERRAHRCQQTRTVVVQVIKRTGLDQSFQHAAIQETFVDAPHQIKQAFVRAFGFALCNNGANRCLATAFDRAQTITNLRCAYRFKTIYRLIDVGRQHLQPVIAAVLIKNSHLVGIRHLGRQRRGHELRRVIRFEPRSVVCDQRVSCGVRFVEAVFGELFHQVEQAFCDFGIDAAFGCAFQKNRALYRHFFGLFLAHRAPQHVRAAEAVAGEYLRDQHHLLLIDDDAVSRFQHRLKIDMEIFRLLLALFTCDEIVDHAGAQWPRPVQRHQRDNVFEAIAFQPPLQILRRTRLGLEHRGGIAVGEELVYHRIVELQLFQPERFAARLTLHEAHRFGQNRQRTQAQKVELDQTNCLDVVLVELRHR